MSEKIDFEPKMEQKYDFQKDFAANIFFATGPSGTFLLGSCKLQTCTAAVYTRVDASR